MSTDHISGFVPAKGTSSRVPNKNLQILRGVPLFLWAAANLASLIPKSRIFVHSESRLILEIARRFGYQGLERPEPLCTNTTTGDELMTWEASQVKSKIVIQHLPPMPFLTRTTLEAITLPVRTEQAMSALGVFEEQSYLWGENGPLYPTDRLPNSVDLPLVTHEGMGIYVANREWLLSGRKRVHASSHKVNLDYFERIDIDYPQQFEIAKFIAEGLPKQSKYVPASLEDPKETYRSFQRPKVMFFDIDGVQTDGGVFVGPSGVSRRFNAQDGQGIKEALALGIEIAFITAAANGDSIAMRAKMLGVETVLLSNQFEKFDRCSEFLDKKGVGWEECWYVGDDTPDIYPMLASAVSIAPKNATLMAQKVADVVSAKQGGHGFIREVCDMVSTANYDEQ